ncbi:MAG: hypothetical protein V2A74_15115 [bacterium]
MLKSNLPHPSTSLPPSSLLAAGAGLFLIELLFWRRCFEAGFLQDDFIFLYRWGRASWGDVASAWSIPPEGNWRPLSVATIFRVLWPLLGLRPWLFHLFNLCLFYLNSLLVWRLVTLLAGDVRSGFIAALLWSTHSCHSLTLYWIWAVGSLLGDVSYLAALLCWFAAWPPGKDKAPSPNKKLLALMGALGFFMLGLASRENVALWPAAAFVALLVLARARPAEKVLAGILLGALGALVWFVLIKPASPLRSEVYGFQFGWNVVRNLLAYGAYLLHFNREFGRALLEEGRLDAGVMLPLLTLATLLAVFYFAQKGGNFASLFRRHFPAILWLVVFALIQLGPFLLLRWNNYAYYVSLVIIAPAAVLGLMLSELLGRGGRERAVAVASLLVLVGVSWTSQRAEQARPLSILQRSLQVQAELEASAPLLAGKKQVTLVVRGISDRRWFDFGGGRAFPLFYPQEVRRAVNLSHLAQEPLDADDTPLVLDYTEEGFKLYKGPALDLPRRER